MFLFGGYDGVVLDYVDFLMNKKVYIYLQIDSSGIIEVEDVIVNVMQISLDGCCNFIQVIDWVWFEVRKIFYLCFIMMVKVLELMQVVCGMVVQCLDMYDNVQQIGYIIGCFGDVFLMLECIDFFFGDMWVVMIDSFGNYCGCW